MRIMALALTILAMAALTGSAMAQTSRPDCITCKVGVSGEIPFVCPPGSERLAGKPLRIRVAAGDTWEEILDRWCGKLAKRRACVGKDGNAIPGRYYLAVEEDGESWKRPECKVPPPAPKPKAEELPAQPPMADAGTCPNGSVMEVNIYDVRRMPPDYQRLTAEITGFELNRGAITTTTDRNRSFSREVGKALGQMARGGQANLWSRAETLVQVFWQKGKDVRQRELVGTFPITGRGSIELPGGETKVASGHLLVVVYPAAFVSPPLGQTTNRREVWFYPSEWTGCTSRQHAAHP